MAGALRLEDERAAGLADEAYDLHVEGEARQYVRSAWRELAGRIELPHYAEDAAADALLADGHDVDGEIDEDGEPHAWVTFPDAHPTFDEQITACLRSIRLAQKARRLAPVRGRASRPVRQPRRAGARRKRRVTIARRARSRSPGSEDPSDSDPPSADDVEDELGRWLATIKAGAR